MAKIEDLVKALNSDIFKESSEDYYERKKRFLRPDCKDKTKFIECLKAACIELYSILDEKHKDELVNELANYKQIEPPFDNYDINFINTINTCAAKENEIVDGKALNHIVSLKQFEDDPIYSEISLRDDLIKEAVVVFNSFTFMDNIKPNIPIKAFGRIGVYVFDEDEINKIVSAKNMGAITNKIHSIYDESNGYDKPTLNVDNIDDSLLKIMAFNTGKDNPEYEIIFDDGTIINYFKGNIRIKPIKFQTLLKLTKLSYVELCREDNQNEIEKLLCDFDNDIDPFDMTDEEFLENLEAAFDHIYKDVYRLDEVYSKKMIEDANSQMNKMNEIIKKYNLK